MKLNLNIKALFKKELVMGILIVLLSIPAILPLLRSDFFHFSDEVHIANLYQMYKSIMSGQMPPRMAPDMSYGFGYPLFNYYYVMPFYIGVILFNLSGSFISAYKILLIVATLSSSVFMYFFLRKFTGAFNSIVGSIVYLYTPYRAVDLYIRGALGEVFAFMMFPLLALLIYRIGKNGSTKAVGVFSLCFAFFILSHNLSPFLIFPWYALFFFAINRNGISGIGKFIVGLFLGVVTASYWLAPAIIESTLLKSTPQFNFYDHYPLVRQLLYSKWGYGASLPGIGDDISFQIGIPNIILVGCGLIITFLTGIKKINWMLTVTLISIIFVVFMMNIRSTSIWSITPLANFIQFPWRLLLLTTFLSSLLVIYIKNKTILICLLLLSFFNVRFFKPSEYFNPDDDYFLNRYFANQRISGETESVSVEYPAWTEDYAILPDWVEKRADFLPAFRLLSKDLVVTDYQKRGGVEYSSRLLSDKGGKLQTYLYYFPGWTGYINNEIISSEIELPYGTMVFDVPPGNWEFRLKWEETEFRKVFNILSIAGLGATFYLIFLKKDNA